MDDLFGSPRARALAILAPSLPPDLVAEAFAAAKEIENERTRAEALAALTTRLAELGYFQEAMNIARELERESARIQALSTMAIRLAELSYHQEALVAAREIRLEPDRSEILAALTIELAELGYSQKSLDVAREIEWEYIRAHVLAALAPRLAKLPRPALYPLWDETLPRLARRTRRDLLADLGALVPVIHALGGEAAIAETFRAIQDVARWWP